MAVFRFKITEPGRAPFFANVGPFEYAHQAKDAIVHSHPDGTEIRLKEKGESEEPPKVETEEVPVAETVPEKDAEPLHVRKDAGGPSGVE